MLRRLGALVQVAEQTEEQQFRGGSSRRVAVPDFGEGFLIKVWEPKDPGIDPKTK